MKNQNENTIPVRIVPVLTLVQAAMIAALYVVLTFAANALGLANYVVQIRFS